ncbi:MAG: hypothetical protein HYX94_02955 [Chloroflexi bacterium]|nr:hypothetical protein [Chloroflexota bacterium]
MSEQTYGRGQILRIDLTSQSIAKEKIPGDVAKRFVGGQGINSWLLWEHFLGIDPRIDPTSPNNVVIGGMGPLGATGYGAGSKMRWTFKSPLTKFFGDSSSGGAFGTNLRWAGYDHIVITGRAPRPVYLWINDDKVEIRDGRRLWGKKVEEADQAIKEETGFADAETACIGVAGENLVTSASLQVCRHRSAGRTGAGCVFGSKNLKAVAARGTKGIPIYDPPGFLKSIERIRDVLNKDEAWRDMWKVTGTMGVFGYYSRFGLLPFRNNQFSSMPQEKAALLRFRWFAENLAVGPLACGPGCISGCSGTYKIKGDESPLASKFAGETGQRIELLVQIGWGGMCDIADMPALAHLFKMSNDFGVDIMEASFGCSFLMELWQRKIIGETDISRWLGEPVSFEWGSYEAAAKVIESIAMQHNALGRIFKDGLYEAATRIGEIKGVNVMQYALYGKGGMPGVTDARTNPSWAIAMAVSSRGADHLKGAFATLERFNRPDISLKHYGRPEAAEFGTPTLKGMDCARSENRCSFVNCLGVCQFLPTTDTILYPASLLAEALSASCGGVLAGEDIEVAGERTVNLEKAFNSRLGLRREDDRLSERWLNEPQVDRPANQLLGSYFERVKDEYYEAHGWDKATSLPTRGKLEELGLHSVAEVLTRDGAIAR